MWRADSSESAGGVSANGTVIVGVGQNPNGDIEAWLYRDRSGLITPSLAARSFASLSGIAETVHSSTATLLSGYRETAPISVARDDRALSRRLSVSSRSALVGVSDSATDGVEGSGNTGMMFGPMPDLVLAGCGRRHFDDQSPGGQ